jgi:hypothetical protein
MRLIHKLILLCLLLAGAPCFAQVRVLTALDVYAALGEDESSPVVESLLELLGGAVAGSVATLDSPSDPNEHHIQHDIETKRGAVVKVFDGEVQAVRFDLRGWKGRLPFGLRRGMQAGDFAPTFPNVVGGQVAASAGEFIRFTFDAKGGLAAFTCLPPAGYCHTRGTHLAGFSFDSLAAHALARPKDYLAWVRAAEDRLRQSLQRNSAVLDTALAPGQHQIWAYELGARAGAYEPGKGMVIDFLTIGVRRRVLFDPEELRDFLVHFPDAQVLVSCTPDRDDCTLYSDRLEVLHVAGRGYLLLPETGMGELPPHRHRGEGAWHGE